MGKPERLKALLARFAAAEERFLAGEFLAPVVGRGEVRVRVAGVVLRLRVEPADFEGWGVFRPLSTTRARLVRPASLAERRQYLELFPLVRLILVTSESHSRMSRSERMVKGQCSRGSRFCTFFDVRRSVVLVRAPVAATTALDNYSSVT